MKRPVNSLWIAAIDYDSEICDYLAKELNVPSLIELVSIKRLLNEHG